VENAGNIPKSILDKLNEFTGGGFILFYVDANGDTQFLPYVDNPTVGRGIISFIDDITTGIRAAEKEDIINLFTNHTDGNSEEPI
jgi:hypothetical protein